MKVVLRLLVVGAFFIALVELLGRGLLEIPNLVGYVLFACAPVAFLWACWPVFPGQTNALRIAARLGLAALAFGTCWGAAAYLAAARA